MGSLMIFLMVRIRVLKYVVSTEIYIACLKFDLTISLENI